MNAIDTKSFVHRPFLLIGLFALVFIAMVGVVYWRLPVDVDWSPDVFSVGVDWKGTYRPAALALLRGENPYAHGLQNPVWVLLPLLPIALLSKELGAAVMFTIGFFVYGYVGFRMGLKWWAILFLLFNQVTLSGFVNGNTDWLVVLGFVLPPQIGLFFVVLKPQIAIGLILFWLVEAWQKGGWRNVLRIFAPVTIAILLTFVIWGFWPAKIYGDRLSDPYNASMFPTLLPLGIVLLIHAFRQHNEKFAMMSSVFFLPYLSYQGYSVALMGLDSVSLVFAVIAIWLMPFLM